MAGAVPQGEPKALRTDPRGFVVRALMSLMRGALPAAAVLIGTSAMGALMVAGAVAGVALFSFAIAWLKWRRLTYTTGSEDIRVEQGLLERSARSVPYERIQDVSIEQKWLPRLFGLAEVKFETGAGGKEEIVLAYLSLEEGERLRELVRERKDGAASAVEAGQAEPVVSEVLFAMDNRRVALFGVFEFSLVVFAVLLGAAQQFDFLMPFDLWDGANWRRWLAGGEAQLAGIGVAARVAGVAAALSGLVLLGLVTGVARTFARDYGFRLERTAKGFRRRRGLFNRSDVLIPVHRVQAVIVRTGLIRRRFGWHALDFVSLAQDGGTGSSDHAAAPFARLEEIWPLVCAAGIEPPADDIGWRRPSARPWVYDTILHGLFFAALGTGGAVMASTTLPLWGGGLAVVATALVNYAGWRRHRHAATAAQLFTRQGTLAPRLTIVQQVKLQSAEVVQSPLGRWRGYATLRLGLAGGRLALPGLPLAEALAIRRAVTGAIAAVDFSRLPR
jgi:putative membrane protein